MCKPILSTQKIPCMYTGCTRKGQDLRDSAVNVSPDGNRYIALFSSHCPAWDTIPPRITASLLIAVAAACAPPLKATAACTAAASAREAATHSDALWRRPTLLSAPLHAAQLFVCEWYRSSRSSRGSRGPALCRSHRGGGQRLNAVVCMAGNLRELQGSA